jgi:hypothetical protein
MELRNLTDGDSLPALCDHHGSEIQSIELHNAVVRHTLTTYADWAGMQEIFDL